MGSDDADRLEEEQRRADELVKKSGGLEEFLELKREKEGEEKKLFRVVFDPLCVGDFEYLAGERFTYANSPREATLAVIHRVYSRMPLRARQARLYFSRGGRRLEDYAFLVEDQ